MARENSKLGSNPGRYIESHKQSENEPILEGHVEDVNENNESSEDEEVAIDQEDDGADISAVDGDGMSSDDTSEDEKDISFTLVESKRARRN